MSGKFVAASDSTDDVKVLVFKKKTKKKFKRSRGTKQIEEAARRMVDSNATVLTTYLKRHKASNRKSRDGWVKDMPINVFKANQKAIHRLKPLKVLGF